MPRIFCGQHIPDGMSDNIPGVTHPCLSFSSLQNCFFVFVSCILNLFCSTLEVNLTLSLTIPFPGVPFLPSPVSDHPSFPTAVPPGRLFQHKQNLAVPAAPKEKFFIFLDRKILKLWEEVEAQVNTSAKRGMIFLRENQKCRTLILSLGILEIQGFW